MAKKVIVTAVRRFSECPRYFFTFPVWSTRSTVRSCFFVQSMTQSVSVWLCVWSVACSLQSAVCVRYVLAYVSIAYAGRQQYLYLYAWYVWCVCLVPGVPLCEIFSVPPSAVHQPFIPSSKKILGFRTPGWPETRKFIRSDPSELGAFKKLLLFLRRKLEWYCPNSPSPTPFPSLQLLHSEASLVF